MLATKYSIGFSNTLDMLFKNIKLFLAFKFKNNLPSLPIKFLLFIKLTQDRNNNLLNSS